MINEFSILNGAKYFSLGTFQNCLVFIPTKKNVKNLVELLALNYGNIIECQKKVLKI